MATTLREHLEECMGTDFAEAYIDLIEQHTEGKTSGNEIQLVDLITNLIKKVDPRLSQIDELLERLKSIGKTYEVDQKVDEIRKHIRGLPNIFSKTAQLLVLIGAIDTKPDEHADSKEA